jgi:hypothetical protein
VLVDLPFYEIVRRYKVDREDPLPADSALFLDLPEPVEFATYEAKYPMSLLNKGVLTRDEEYSGHVMKDTDDKIVIRRHYDWRFDVPSQIYLQLDETLYWKWITTLYLAVQS